MAIESKYKKRGSNLSLILMLIVLIILVIVILKWPIGGETEAAEEPTTETTAPEATEAKAQAVEATAAGAPAKSEEDDVEKTTLINVGDTAPDFTVTMLDGRQIKLSELRGNVVMLCFWATWCPPCRQELSHLQADVIDKYQGKKLVVLPISRGEKRDVVEKFIIDNGYKFGVGLDTDRKIYDQYASNYIPRTFIINKQGKVVYRTAGYDEEVAKQVDAAIQKALK